MYTSLIQDNAANSKSLLLRTVNKLFQKNSDQLYRKAAENIQLEIQRVQSDSGPPLHIDDNTMSSFSYFKHVSDSDVLNYSVAQR